MPPSSVLAPPARRAALRGARARVCCFPPTPQRSALRWLVGGLLVALGYPVVKYLEIRWNLAHDINGGSGIFFTVYYYLTFNHLVHAVWGILGIFWVLARLLFQGYSAKDYSGLEALASYWHATDIIWLIIFPLFYVLA